MENKGDIDGFVASAPFMMLGGGALNSLRAGSKTFKRVGKAGDNIQSGAACVLSFAACFVSGTQVFTDQGLKNIEDIKVGDFVLSKDPITGKTDYKPVVNTFIIQPNFRS